MDRENVVIDAHGSVSSDHFMVVPPGTKVALTGTVGTSTYMSPYEKPDFDQKRFLTWYYEDDIMPYIRISIMNMAVNATINSLDIDFFSMKNKPRDRVSLRQIILDNPGKTIYVTCCLGRGPPEFSPVKHGKLYESWFHKYAPPIRGITLPKGEVLVHTKISKKMKRQVPNCFIVHPSLCPKLFKTLFVDGKLPSTSSVSILWVHMNRYWEVLGSGDNFRDVTNRNIVTDFRIQKSSVPLTKSIIDTGLEDKRGMGIIQVHGKKLDLKHNLGIYLVSKQDTDNSLSYPIWDSWTVEPVRKGGLDIPGMAKYKKAKQIYVGKVSSLRGGQGVPWVPQMASGLEGGNEWANRRTSVQRSVMAIPDSRRRDSMDMDEGGSKFQISKSVKPPDYYDIGVQYVQGYAKFDFSRAITVPDNMFVMMMNSVEQDLEGDLDSSVIPGVGYFSGKINSFYGALCFMPYIEEISVIRRINNGKTVTNETIYGHEELFESMDNSGHLYLYLKNIDKGDPNNYNRYHSLYDKKYMYKYTGMYTRIAPRIDFLKMRENEYLFESLLGENNNTRNPFYLLHPKTCKSLFIDLILGRLNIYGCSVFWIRGNKYRVVSHNNTSDEDYLFNDLNHTLGMQAALDTTLDVGKETAMVERMGYGILCPGKEFAPQKSGGYVLDYTTVKVGNMERKYPVFIEKDSVSLVHLEFVEDIEINGDYDYDKGVIFDLTQPPFAKNKT